MEPCSICESTIDVIKPMCCGEKNPLCRECIRRVEKCPFCRTPKDTFSIPEFELEYAMYWRGRLNDLKFICQYMEFHILTRAKSLAVLKIKPYTDWAFSDNRPRDNSWVYSGDGCYKYPTYVSQLELKALDIIFTKYYNHSYNNPYTLMLYI
jgi:hypothetical protein